MKKTYLFLLSLITLGCFAQSKSDSISVTLQQALEIALSESPTIRIADRAIETKKYYKKEQLVNLFPNVTGGASYQRTIQKQKMVMDFMGQSMEIEVGTFNNAVLSANLTLPIIAPALWNTIKLTSLDIELAEEQARASKISLINTVKKAYFSVLSMQELYRVYLENYKLAEQNAEMISNRYKQGLVSEFEKLRAEVQVQNLKPNLNLYCSAINISQKALKIHMGVDLDEPMIFEGELKDFETEMIAAKLPEISALSLNNNSDLKQMDMAMQQLERSRKIVLSSACPMLALSGSYQYMTMGNDVPCKDFNWFPYSVVGMSLQIPIISWVSTHYKIKQFRYNIQSLSDMRLNAERMLWLAVSNNLSKIDKAIADFESCSESVNMAIRAHSIVQKQYEVGLATWLDLNGAELALTNAQLMYYQSIYDYLVAQAELEYVLGRN
jgi:outer membrane protein TolC